MSAELILGIPYFLLAALVVVLAFWLAKRGSALVEAAWLRTAAHRATAKFLKRFTYTATLVLGLTVALKVAGFDAMIFVGAITLGAGFALRSWFSNLVAGMIIVTTKLFDVKSFIGTADGMGSILSIDAMLTTLKTLTNQTIKIPNSSIVGGPITLFGQYPERLVKLEAWSSVDENPETVMQQIEAYIQTIPAVSNTPESPMVLLTDVSEGFMTFNVRLWVTKSALKLKKTSFALWSKQLQRDFIPFLEERGVEAPYLMSTLHVNAHDSGDLASAQS